MRARPPSDNEFACGRHENAASGARSSTRRVTAISLSNSGEAASRSRHAVLLAEVHLGRRFRVDGGASKYGYSLKPNILAVMFDGNCRRSVLYACTRSL